MYGFELNQFLRLIVQLFAVIAGSASLWGAVFAYKAKKEIDSAKKESFYSLSRGALKIFCIFMPLFFIGWWFLSVFIFPIKAVAHEGVVHSLDFPREYVQNGFNVNLFWVSILGIFNFLAFIMYRIKKLSLDFFKKYSFVFFLINFLFLSIIISLSSFTKQANLDQLTLILHNWHSFLTLGTVILVDLMYLYTFHKEELKKVLYPFYPLMSVAIWMGLGIDFIASFLIVGRGLPENTQFIFNQIVVVILVINGALLSVRINDKLISLVSDVGGKLNKKWGKIIHISGSISIVSWFTIVFLDFFNFSFSLVQFFIIYIFVILCAFLAKPIIEKHFVKL